MNILEQEDIIKGLPDKALMKEASAPSGQVPQFLVVSEIKRRTDMRKRHEEQQQQQNQGTVKDQIMMEAMGIGSVMPPQMAPQQPPMAPMGAPPMGGMPPQGMPPMAPPQTPKPPMPQGGMPPMPMGGIASAPPAMPPMGMAQGGIVQMQTGRQAPNDPALRLRSILASNPGITFADLMSMGFTQADLERLSNLGYQERIDSERILGDAISGLERVDPEMRLSKTIPTQVKPASDIYSQSAVTGFAGDMSRAAQENMPNYGMINPASGEGIGPALSSLDDAVAGGITSVLGGVPQYSVYDPNSPSSVFSRSAGSLMQESLDEAAGRRQGIVDVLTGKFRYKPESIALLEAEQSGDITREERKLALAGKQSPDDAAVQGASPAQVQANGMLSEYTDYAGLLPAAAADNIAAQSPYTLEYLQKENARMAGRDAAQGTDLGTFAGEDVYRTAGARTVDVTGEVTPETRLTDAVTELPRNDRSTPEMPTLDFSDLIAEGKQQALANAMIQLGAGVASGDVAKGLSAAGTAAMKGTADARALDMKRRLAEYQAGREDIRRGEEAERFERQMTSKESQFERQLGQLERKIDATIDVSNATTQRENLRALAGEVGSLREQILTMSPSEKARFRALESQLYQMLGIDMPDAEVTAGLSGKDLSGLESLIGG